MEIGGQRDGDRRTDREIEIGGQRDGNRRAERWR